MTASRTRVCLALLVTSSALAAEGSEQKFLTASIAFGRDVHVADVDGDGKLDALTASYYDGKFAWHRNVGGGEVFGLQQVIHSGQGDGECIHAADLDGDGDLDVITVAYFDGGRSNWFENLDGQGTFGPEQLIDFGGAEWVDAGDLDGDGDLDLVFSGLSGLEWFENSDGAGTFVPRDVLFAGTLSCPTVRAVDVDADGDLDIVSGKSGFFDGLILFENLDGAGGFGPEQVVTTLADDIESIVAADFDVDGDLDLAAGSFTDSQVAWYPNEGGGLWGAEVSVDGDADECRSIDAADWDLDGDPDLFITSQGDNRVELSENLGQGLAWSKTLITSLAAAPQSVFAADLDGDGDPDAFTASGLDDTVAYYRNLGTGWGAQWAIVSKAVDPQDVLVTDLDGDGVGDALVASRLDDKVSWFRSDPGIGPATYQRIITTATYQPARVHAVDLDQDGDRDVLSATIGDEELAWYENDGAGGFGPQTVIGTGDGLFELFDLDGDGDTDLLWVDQFPGTGGKDVSWLENLDGLGTFAPSVSIVSPANYVDDVTMADLNLDGELDLALTFQSTLETWFNGGGASSFLPGQVVFKSIEQIESADLDADGDQDLVIRDGANLLWYPNNGITLAIPKTIDTLSYGAFQVADFDGDGDQDVVAARSSGPDVVELKNTGNGTFDPPVVLTATSKPLQGLAVGDLDGDADMDVLGFDSAVSWLETCACPADVQPSQTLRFGSGGSPNALRPSAIDPLVGLTWAPYVDHSTFLPGATLDLIGISLVPTDQPFPPYGTLLVALNPAPLFVTGPPGVPFAIPIPNDCLVAGLALTSQAWSVSPGDAQLTNAIDVVIGSL